MLVSLDLDTPKTLDRAIASKTALINKSLKKIAKKAEIDKNISFHVARHTFATIALKKGMRIEYVSKLLNHRNIKTTQIYSKIIDNELDLALDNLNF